MKESKEKKYSYSKNQFKDKEANELLGLFRNEYA